MNNPVRFTDPDGRSPQDFTILIAKDGARGRGHMAAIIQDGEGRYYYVTMGAAENTGLVTMATIGVHGGMKVQELKGAKTMNEARNIAKKDKSNSPYTEAITFDTNSAQDHIIYEKTLEKAENINSHKENYNVITNNCTDGCEEPIEDALDISLPSNPEPNSNFETLKNEKVNIQKDINSRKKENYNLKNEKEMNIKVKDNTQI